MSYIEKCSCGAEFSASESWTADAIRELAKMWRENHHHDFGPELAPEPPLIHESGSSHERQLNEFGVTDRVPLGFQRHTG